MKNENGITIIKLSFIVIVALFSIATIIYVYESSIRISELEKFVLNMEKLQEKVSTIANEQYKLWEEYDVNEAGNFNQYLQSLGFTNANSSKNIYIEDFSLIIKELNSKTVTNWNSNIDSILANYCYFTPDELEKYFDLKNTNLHVIINFYTGNIISKNGIKNVVDDGKIIYRQYDTSIGNSLKFKNNNMLNPEIEIVSNYGLSQKIKIFFKNKDKNQIPNILEIYYYDNDNEDIKMKCTEISDYKYVIEEKSAYFTISNSGNYSFIVEDTNFVEYPKLGLDINLCNPPNLLDGMIGIYWDETGSEIKTELVSDKNWYNYSSTDLKMANAISSDGNYWVWIPRFTYKEINEGISINYVYENSLTSTKNKNTIGYKVHTAFTEDDNIKGFWVAKFQSNIEGKDYISILPGQTLSLATLSLAKTNCKKLSSKNLSEFASVMSDNKQDAILKIANAFKINISNDLVHYSGGGVNQKDFLNNTRYSSSGNVYGVYDLIASENEITSNYTGNKEGRYRPVLVSK